MVEIERKFLVLSESYRQEAYKSTRIVQGFLNKHPERTVRVRIKGDQGFLTIKGKSNDSGTVRYEWERKITVAEARELLAICEQGIIDKVRYEVKKGDHIYEIDEFFEENEGLVIAEIELSSEEESFEVPEWLGKEVTGDIKYYNSQLSIKPFNQW